MTHPHLTRRHVLATASAGVAAAAVAGAPAPAGAAAPSRNSFKGRPDELLIRGGYVITMDSGLGDLERADVHIKKGNIVAVAAGIKAPGARVINAADSIVMPGFVETHYHMWNSIWRGMANDAGEYFRLQAIANFYTPEDHYNAVKFAALDLLNQGITTCHNWAHGVRSYDDAQAEMSALRDSGIRAKHSYLAAIKGALTSRADLERAQAWMAEHGEGRLGLGMLTEGASGLDGPLPAGAVPTQVALARELGLRPITDHGGGFATPDVAGPEFMLTHAAVVSDAQLAFLKAKDVKVSFSPHIDPMIAAGYPQIYRMIKGGIPPENISVSVDVTAQTHADPFSLIRSVVNAGRVQQKAAGDTGPSVLTYRDALRMGTIHGANVLGLAGITGSLVPGKRADVITVRTDMMNMLPAGQVNRAWQLVQNAQSANVDTVVVDGIVRKVGGELVGVDPRELAETAAASIARIRARAGLAPIDTTR